MHKTDLRGFSHVDQTESPDQFVQFLDTINSWPFFRDEQKPRSLEMLAAQPGHHILDVGCGLGDVARMLGSRVGPGGRVVGTDLSQRLIAEAQRRTTPAHGPVEFHVGNAESLPWPTESFHGCRADRVLMFMERPHQAVREMVRVLRPGGRIVLGEFDMETAILASPHRLLTRRLVNYWCDSIPNSWIGRQLPGLFQDLGLKNLTIVPLLFRLTSYAEWNSVFQIEITVERARQANIVSAQEADLWLQQLRDADTQGRFYLALTLFMIAGQKQ